MTKWGLACAGSATKIGVFLDEGLPIRRNVGVHEDGAYWALCFAKAAVNALVRINHHLIVHLVNAIDRANGHARLIHHSDTGFSYYVRQLSANPPDDHCNQVQPVENAESSTTSPEREGFGRRAL